MSARKPPITRSIALSFMAAILLAAWCASAEAPAARDPGFVARIAAQALAAAAVKVSHSERETAR